MEPIQSILDIPFAEHELVELLNLHDDRDLPDFDYARFGHARAGVLCLEERGGLEPLPLVRDALILALHSAEDPEPLDGDIELEFFVEEVAKDYSVTVLLSDFLERWLPLVSGGERAVVLVLCNPHGAAIARPDILGATPLYYAVGDVESWLDMEEGRPLIRLMADAWRLAD
jgi:hypothetical protein